MAFDLAVDQLEVKLLHFDVWALERGRDGDAGYDLSCVESFVLRPGERKLVPTGVAIALPSGVAGLVMPRSGLAIRHGIACVNSPGLIDPNYRGELRVILVNHGEETYRAHAGDRIAQLLLVPYWAPEMQVVEELPDTDRGGDGFGSSGR